MKSNSIILWENPHIVAIASGLVQKSQNIKTGSMVQVWILVKSQNPLAAVASGKDAHICGNCPLRKNTVTGQRSCYVNLGQAPLAIWRKWKAGNTPNWNGDAAIFTGRKIRWGAYGDPVFIPLPIIKSISAVSAGWTGYTHQWKNPLFSAYRDFLMGSADTLEDYHVASAAGWRTFRVSESPAPGEILCVNASRGIQCADCLLCAGNSKRAKSITIPAHGTGKIYHPSKN